MADLTQVIRWNAGFLRGLAQSVLDRAKVIRSSLGSGKTFATTLSAETKRITVKKAAKRKTARAKAARPARTKTKKG